MLGIVSFIIITVIQLLSLILAIYLFIKCLKVFIKNRIKIKSHHKLKFRLWHYIYHLREERFIDTIEFIKWVIIDIFRGKDRIKLFGIWCFTGYYGEGKSLGAVNFAKNLQKKHPHKKINIAANFYVKGSNIRISKWQDLLELPKNTIVIFDEIQSTFTSQKYAEFPIELLWKITQCRKRGLAIFCTSPVYTRMSIQLRESTDFVIQCKNIFKLDRWFSYTFYRAPVYEMYREQPLKLFMNKYLKYNLVAQDRNYKIYNTEEEVDRLDIEGEDKNTKIKKYDFNKLRNELIKYVDEKMKKIS